MIGGSLNNLKDLMKTQPLARLGGCLLATLTLTLTSTLPLQAAVPPPEKLLGKDTLLVVTVPDVDTFSDKFGTSPAAKFWADPSMKAFTEKFSTRFSQDIVKPLEKELGIQFSDYSDLIEGQMTMALNWDGGGEDGKSEPTFLLMMDAGSKSGRLKDNLDELKKKWVDSGKTLKNESIRGVDFTTMIFKSDALGNAVKNVFPDPDEGYETLGPPRGRDRNKESKKPKTIEWHVGQADSLLIVGDSKEEIQKVLTRKAGGSTPSLDSNEQFQSDFAKNFRKATFYGWVNLGYIMDAVTKQMAKERGNRGNQPAPFPSPDKIIASLGLTGLKSAGLSVQELPEGTLLTTSVQIPASMRKGLFKMLAFKSKDSSPLPFVPADVTKFSRTRLDMKQAWNTLEGMLTEMSPQMAGVINLFMANAGKDQDPNFDLRQNLIGNLGDDIVSFEKPPREKTLEGMASPPGLVLISSPEPEQLADATKAIASLTLGQGGKIKERDFLGRKVYSMPFAAPGQPRGQTKVSFVASGGYLAISTDTALIEEYLRNKSARPLRSTSGLVSAAEKVGGMDSGVFGYENDKKNIEMAFEILKNESGNISQLFSASGMGERLAGEGAEATLEDWLDFKLLPPFSKVAKYFYFSVYGGGMTQEGMTFKLFTPVPPGL